MEMDDGLMGEAEFKLSPEQGEAVALAIELASSRRGDDFSVINPLLVIMQWWEAHVPEAEKLKAAPEATLTEACRRYVLAHAPRSPSLP
jgi:hypothetical protein